MNVKPTKLQELGRALDHAEATIPAMHRLRARYYHRVTGKCDMYGKRDLIFPNHSAVKNYLDLAVALACFDQIESPRDPKELRSHIRRARKDLNELHRLFRLRCEYRDMDVQWCDGGKGVSLRTIINIYADRKGARADLQRLEIAHDARKKTKADAAAYTRARQRTRLRSMGLAT